MRAESWPGPVGPAPRAQPDAPAPSGPAMAVDLERPHGAHPRILLTPERLAAQRALRAAGTPSGRRLLAQCDDDARETIGAGYEAWDWANATLDLALCGAITGRTDYPQAALRYFRALLDDRHKVGDGAGGDEVVHHDDGYSIRTRGCFGAIAYDWLHDAPGMTAELRKHAVDRFVAWNRWFGESGYARDQPIANYYVGWFGALAFAGIAAQGDDPRATDLLRAAQRMYRADIVPAYRRKLAGGDFPEGWQYGDMVGAILAIFADAESQSHQSSFAAAAQSPFDELAWLRQTRSLPGARPLAGRQAHARHGRLVGEAGGGAGAHAPRAGDRAAAGRRRGGPGARPRSPRERPARRGVALARGARRRSLARRGRPTARTRRATSREAPGR